MIRLLLFLAALFGGAMLAAQAADVSRPRPTRQPVARIEPVTDVHFGDAVTDPYRWMENDKDPQWRPFLEGQDAHARSMLAGVPHRGAILARVRKLSAATAMPRSVQPAGRGLFFEQRPPGSSLSKLFVREAGKVRVLVDPSRLDEAGGHLSLDWWRASPDGSKVAYGLSRNGSEDATLHVVDVRTGAVSPERIGDTQNAEPQWLADGSGFFYNQLTGKVGTPERFLDSRARFHRLGTDPATDPIVMARGLDPGVVYDRIQSPSIVTSPTSDRVVLALADVRRERRFFLASLADVLNGRAQWQAVASFDDEVWDVDIHGDELHLLAFRDHPRGRVLKLSASDPSISAAKEVLPESAWVLQAIRRARDGLYVAGLDGGVGTLQRVGPDGARRTVTLPFDGTIASLMADPQGPGVFMTLTGWLRPAGIWSVDADGRVQDTRLTPAPPIDLRGYETVRRYATAKDGTRIPYTLLYRKGMLRNGANPAFVSAYGSYGATPYTPSFAARTLALLDRGAVVGYAGVRGGGEYGREWHRAGQLENKANTWRDLIAVCEDMVRSGYTEPGRLAIGGVSAGGITVGRAMTERPDLFAAVVSRVGWHNPLRYVAEQNGYGEEPEWGAIGDERGYRALKLIDSYQAVRDGTRYPAVLLTTGVEDPRVAPFHVAKMAARLQAASVSGKPVLLRVDFDAGHGIGSTREQQDEEAADVYGFVLWQTRESRRARGAQDVTSALPR